MYTPSQYIPLPLNHSKGIYRRIESVLPRQWGNVSLSNLTVLNAILFVAEQGCKWRGLPKCFGNWHTIYTRDNGLWRMGKLTGILSLPDVGSKTTTFSSACASIFVSN